MTDLHVHSNASDGTDTPEELLQKIRNSGIKIFALTDHDTIKGTLKLKKIIPSDIKFVKGIEFSCLSKNSKCHILGLNYDENNKNFQEALKAGEKLRHDKFYKRIEFLRDEFNVAFTSEDIENLLKIPSVGKIHLGNLLVEKGLAKNCVEAMENIVDKCKTGNDKIDAELAISSINASGGIAVWAHPLGGAREKELPEDKFQKTLSELKSYGLRGLECYYSKYEYEKCEWLSRVAYENNLLVSGGSDYHGMNKKIPLGRLNADNIEINEELLTILTEI